MKTGNLFRKALPYIVAVVVFWAVSALYFAPQFEDKTLTMTDVQMYDGMKKDISQHRAAFDEDPQWTGGMFGGMPAYLITVEYPAMIIRNAVQWFLSAMGEPMSLMFLTMLGFWLMLLMCGVDPWVAIPAALAYGLSTYNILIVEAGHITKIRAMGYAPMLVGAVVYTFRRNVWIGGALAALFGTLTIAAAHPQITYYFLLVLLACWINEFVVTIRDKGLGADVIKPGEGMRHRAPGQIGKFSPWGSLKLFGIRKGWGRFWLATGVLVLAAVLAGGANFTHLWYTAEHSPDTTRGGSELAAEKSVDAAGLDLEYATAWSYGTGESFNMFVPNFSGGASSETFEPDGEVSEALGEYGIPQLATQLSTYWGEQPFTGGPTYIGAVAMFLFVLGMFVLPGRKKWWILGVSVLGLLLAWGRNAMWFTELSFAVLPGYNKFRTVSMALAILQWSIPFVAALVMSELWKGKFAGMAKDGAKQSPEQSTERQKFVRGLWWSLGITGGSALLFAVLGGSLFDFSSSADFDRMYNFALQGGVDKNGATQFADHIVGAMSVERLDLFRADCWRSLLFVVLTAAVVWLWISQKGLKRWLAVTAVGVLVLADLVPVDLRFVSHDDFHARSRIEVKPDEADLAILADKEPGFRVLNTQNPFNEAYTSYFHRSIGGYHGAKLRRYQDLIDRYLSKMDMGMLNMLDTKYIIVTDPETGVRTARLNPEAFGPAWFVSDVLWVDGAAAELDALETTDLRTTAVVDERFRTEAGNLPPTEIGNTEVVLMEYRPNYLKYQTSSSTGGLVVFSEIYYDKGWTAYIDGEEAPCFRADYILRAMVVPAGEHVVEWRFRAPRFALVEGITLACSIVILLWLGTAVFLERRKRKTSQ